MCITYISYGYSSKTILYIRVPRAHPRREGSRVRLLHGLRRVRVPVVAVPGGGHPLCRAVDIPSAVLLMKRTVPEFKSKNSPYEQYDLRIERERQAAGQQPS